MTNIHYGPKAAGREKSALRVTKQPSLRETSWPNGLFKQLALLDSWKSLSREYTQRFSRFWDHLKGPYKVGQVLKKIKNIEIDKFGIFTLSNIQHVNLTGNDHWQLGDDMWGLGDKHTNYDGRRP